MTPGVCWICGNQHAADEPCQNASDARLGTLLEAKYKIRRRSWRKELQSTASTRLPSSRRFAVHDPSGLEVSRPSAALETLRRYRAVTPTKTKNAESMSIPR